MNLFEDWLGTGLVATVAATLSVLAAAVLLFIVLRRFLLPLAARAVAATAFRWDDVLIDSKLQRWLALLLSSALVHLAAPIVPGLNDFWTEFWFRVTAVAAILAGTLVIGSLMMAVNKIYETLPISRAHPIKGYLQVVQIVLYLFGDVWVLAILTSQSPWYFLSGLGAAAAVLLIFYRETILSFIASMQLAQNDMLRVGDWIEMPQFGADGDVIDVALPTVKVQNWDKTITTIPTYKLISESFRNWRGMREAGCRRIKRSINLDISSIRFLTDGEIDRYEHSAPLIGSADGPPGGYDWVPAVNPSPVAETTRGFNRPTNVDAFRSYLITQLRRHPDIMNEMPLVVRQLPPERHGLPLEIYVFSRET
nr:mechanosensitive ion channel [Gemmatimonadales bacterium]